MGYVYLALSIGFFTLLGFFTKLGSLKGASSLGLTFFTFLSAFLFSLLGRVFLLDSPVFILTDRILFFASIAGVSAVIANLLLIVALRAGHYGFSVAIVNFAFIVPVLFAVIFWGEQLRLPVILGIALITVSLFVVARSGNSTSSGTGKDSCYCKVSVDDKVRVADRVGMACGDDISGGTFEDEDEIDRSEDIERIEKSYAPGIWGSWLLPIFGSFFFNGITLTAQAVAGKFNLDALLFAMMLYLSGSIVSGILSFPMRALGIVCVLYGALCGLSSTIGIFSLIESLRFFPNSITFPICLVGPVMIGQIISIFVFKEKLSILGLLGVITGLVGVSILAFASGLK